MLILFLLLLPLFFLEFIFTGKVFLQETRLVLTLGVGFFAGLVAWFVVLKRWNWIGTFGHELAHALLCLLFFRRITGFRVTAMKGGYVKHKGSFGGAFGDLMITLAPYYLPTWTLILLLFYPWIPVNLSPIYLMFTGFTLAWHFFGNFQELRQNWTSGSSGSDIRKAGYFTSLIVVLSLNLFFYLLFFRILSPKLNVFPGLFQHLVVLTREVAAYF